MTTRLRPHHLLCMLSFASRGYSAAFIKNFEEVVQRVSTGNETIEIVDGPDDVCAPLLTELDSHCNSASITVRDRYAAEALSDLLRQPVQAKEQVLLDQECLHAMRQAFAEGRIRRACVGCQWTPFCDAIARNSFKETQLLNEGTEDGSRKTSMRS
jgi:uncharacterized protein